MELNTCLKIFFYSLFFTVLYCKNAYSQVINADQVWAYEGFDYYEQGTVAIPEFDFTATKNTTTRVPEFSTTGTPLHEICTSGGPQRRELTVNSPTSLGWAGDWIQSNGAVIPVPGGVYVTDVNNGSIPITDISAVYSVVNSGLYIRGGGNVSVGRRLQTSTAGSFFVYSIIGAPLANGTNPIDPNLIIPSAFSPIRFNQLGSNFNSKHNTDLTNGPTGVAPRSHTNNTSLGADGSTIWVAFMMRKDRPDDEPCYISLHRNGDPWDVINSPGSIQIGYFGNPSNAGGQRYWGLRVNGGAPIINSSNDETRITPGNGVEFDMLVAEIRFNYTTGHIVRLYVFRDRDRNVPPATIPTPLYTAPGGNIASWVNNPSVLATLTDVPEAIIPAGVDPSFHSLAYYPGISNEASALDEIRFAGNFNQAALTSGTISLIKGLCEANGGTSGENIYPEGSFGIAESLNPNGSLNTTVTPANVGERIGNNNVYAPVENLVAKGFNPAIRAASDPECGGNDANCPVVFEDGTRSIGSIQYNNVSGASYNYQIDAGPNDGNYTIATQSRHQFSNSWYPIYDNTSADRNGMMMIVNAAYQKGEFFVRNVSGLCADTQYEFYIDIFNLFNTNRRTITRPGATNINHPTLGTIGVTGNQRCDPALEPGCQQFSNPGTDVSQNTGIGSVTNNSGTTYGVNPEVQFSISQVPVYTPPVSVPNDLNWHRVGFTFVTKSNLSGPVRVAFRNIAPGGGGNDLALDNITFRPCGPRSEIEAITACDGSGAAGGGPGQNVVRVLLGAAGAGYTAPELQWQYSCDGGQNWTDLLLPTPIDEPFVDEPIGYFLGSLRTSPANSLDIIANSILNGGPLDNGCLVRALVAGNGTLLTNPLCRVIVDPYTVNCLNPLFLNGLLSFTVKREIEGIRVVWTTEQESDIKSYVLERSSDGKTFSAIAGFEAQGQQKNRYVYLDRVPFTGKNFYRIKVVKAQEPPVYSKIELIEWNGSEAGVVIYPNPANQEVNITFSDSFSDYTLVQVNLLDHIGAKISNQEYPLQAGQKSLVLPTSHLPRGWYLLEIRVGEQKIIHKLVVQH